ncbi:MAG: VacJ family lipoprotein [Alphaproteobacteria bacterium]|nr:VacJ family lipoprotein [Alphaproteobacteria bacterium]
MKRWVHELRSLTAGLAGLLVVAGCASPTSTKNEIPDPLEGLNRYVFNLNVLFDDVLLRPTAQAYREVVPEFGQRGIRNFLDNLESPVTLANDVFQGELTRAGNTTARFLINTTVGIGGVFDVATDVGFERHEEDFGQTLGRYGVDHGFYLVLPLFGPSSGRDAVGRVGDYFLDPLNYYARNTDRRWISLVRTGVNAVDLRARNLDTLDDIERTSTDLYATIRSIYRQRRASEVANGAAPKLPDE